MGKNIEHVAVWKKGDDRTTYNVIYVDGKSGRSFAKRFNVIAVTRDKEYDLTTGAEGSRVVHLTANPNGESEIVEVHLSSGSKARIKVFDFDFSSIAIKGRGSKGNMVTKYPVRKVVQKELGKSTLGAQKHWMDTASGRLNQDERGKYLGAFDTGDYLLTLHKDGAYMLSEVTPTARFDIEELAWIGRFQPDVVISAVYYEGEKGWTMVKRFQIETTSLGQRYKFITEHKGSKLYYATTDPQPEIRYTVKAGNRKQEHTLYPEDFIDVKGWRALGNKLTEYKIIAIEEVARDEQSEPDEVQIKGDPKPVTTSSSKAQGSLFPEDENIVKQKPKKATKAAKPPASKSSKKSPAKKSKANKAAAKTATTKKTAAKKQSSGNGKKGGGKLKTGDTIEW